ncbi:MAG: hypothetical protein AAF253_08200 [Pseudomonadota bacterium]
MVIQFAIGSGLIVLTVVIATVLMSVALEVFYAARAVLFEVRPIARSTAALSVMTLSTVVVLTIVMWMWALALWGLGAADGLEAAIEVTMLAFTTLGGGEQDLADDWALLPGFIGTGGFILFGLSTAFMFEAVSEIRSGHRQRRGE